MIRSDSVNNGDFGPKLVFRSLIPKPTELRRSAPARWRGANELITTTPAPTMASKPTTGPAEIPCRES
jgi:hypothetical protein